MSAAPRPRAPRPVVPELGPALGRLTSLPGARVAAPPPPRVELADLRLGLVDRVFALAHDARMALDADGAAELLSAGRWQPVWERAVEAAAARTAGRIEDALAEAAADAALPARRRRRLALTKEERQLLRARLDGAGVPFFDAIAHFDAASPGSAEWRDRLLAAMHRLEDAWLEVEQRGLAEEAAWGDAIARVRAWRPSPWPRRVLAVLLAAAAGYLGLVLGGFVPTPAPLAPLVTWWWSR